MRRSTDVASADPAELPEVLQFMRLLWELVHALDRASKHMTQQLGVTGPQRLALRVIGLFPGISAGQLAHILHVHPSTLTGVLQRLIAQRLVERTSLSTDRRRAQLRLTARGIRIDRVTEGTVEAAVRHALRDTSPRDRAAAQRLIVAVSRQLQQQLDAAGDRSSSR
jgi:MarR family transcriptional regulator, organic hydroperoxide resistance regulator